MAHGTYNLINHTTGERYENIVVGQDSQLEARQSRAFIGDINEPGNAAANDAQGDGDSSSRSRSRGSVFIGVDVDAVAFGGGEVTVGGVVDLDSPGDSGVFVTSGSAGGGNLGVGLTVGASMGSI